VRILARAWVDIIWACWTTNTPYDDPAGQLVGLVRRVVIVLSIVGLHDLSAVGSS
jgi:hypothetical protein